jgi:hypothetical protein
MAQKYSMQSSISKSKFKLKTSKTICLFYSITAKRFFGIRGQLFFSPRGQARVDAMLAGDLSERFATLKFGYY